jgi:hypothetical protein
MDVLQRGIAVGLAVFVVAVTLFSWSVSSLPGDGSKGFAVTLSSNGQTLISDQDVSYYNVTSHELGLSPGCVSMLKGMDLYHKAFEVRLDGRLLGNGSFWSNMDSMPAPRGLTLLDIVTLKNGFSSSVWMEACYPYGYYANCTTPSFFGDLAAHFESLGKLVS